MNSLTQIGKDCTCTISPVGSKAEHDSNALWKKLSCQKPGSIMLWIPKFIWMPQKESRLFVWGLVSNI